MALWDKYELALNESLASDTDWIDGLGYPKVSSPHSRQVSILTPVCITEYRSRYWLCIVWFVWPAAAGWHRAIQLAQAARRLDSKSFEGAQRVDSGHQRARPCASS